MTSENVYTEIVAERGAKVIPDLLRGNAGNVGEIGALLDLSADEIDCLRVDLAKAQKKADDIHLELRIVKHQLEQARIWNGSGWDWNPLHGHLARKMWLRLDNLTRSNTEETK